MYPNLKLQLYRLNIRQNRLARIVGVHETLLSKMINGFRTPTRELRLSIARALHSDPDWLFEPCDPAGFAGREPERR